MSHCSLTGGQKSEEACQRWRPQVLDWEWETERRVKPGRNPGSIPWAAGLGGLCVDWQGTLRVWWPVNPRSSKFMSIGLIVNKTAFHFQRASSLMIHDMITLDKASQLDLNSWGDQLYWSRGHLQVWSRSSLRHQEEPDCSGQAKESGLDLWKGTTEGPYLGVTNAEPRLRKTNLVVNCRMNSRRKMVRAGKTRWDAVVIIWEVTRAWVWVVT